MTMLSRITACCLAVLVLAPFTAPFPTCDLAALLGGQQTRHAPMKAPSSTALASDVNVASVPAINHIARARLLQPSHAASSAVECFSATATLARAAASSNGMRDRSALATILRV